MFLQVDFEETMTDDISRISDSSDESDDDYIEYGRKEGGRRLCVIFSNFLQGDRKLTGYRKDIQGIKHFFGDILGYEVRGGGGLDDASSKPFRELSKTQFCVKLQELQDEISDDKTFDRLFIFVLSRSHDEFGGIATRPEVNSKEEGYLEYDDVVNYFNQGKVKSMRGYPKCFFVQVCITFCYIFYNVNSVFLSS